MRSWSAILEYQSRLIVSRSLAQQSSIFGEYFWKRACKRDLEIWGGYNVLASIAAIQEASRLTVSRSLLQKSPISVGLFCDKNFGIWGGYVPLLLRSRSEQDWLFLCPHGQIDGFSVLIVRVLLNKHSYILSHFIFKNVTCPTHIFLDSLLRVWNNFFFLVCFI